MIMFLGDSSYLMSDSNQWSASVPVPLKVPYFIRPS